MAGKRFVQTKNIFRVCSSYLLLPHVPSTFLLSAAGFEVGALLRQFEGHPWIQLPF
jgi:hypothetical protein